MYNVWRCTRPSLSREKAWVREASFPWAFYALFSCTCAAAALVIRAHARSMTCITCADLGNFEMILTLTACYDKSIDVLCPLVSAGRKRGEREKGWGGKGYIEGRGGRER